MALLRFGTLLLLCAPSAAHRAVTHVNHLDSESAEVLQAAKPPPEKLTPLQWRLQLIPDTACGDEKYTKKGAILQRACSGGAIKKYRPNPIITFQEFADELDKSGDKNLPLENGVNGWTGITDVSVESVTCISYRSFTKLAQATSLWHHEKNGNRWFSTLAGRLQ
eukprot:TRINITY_DN25155_c0_g2_i2.p2 TRINITY_DN25155_c0_g2~~TRINITY_DN25155_c0_g2_i2.p2  ORF type:complete len:165 (-),score=29.27 TRINITY_DN25155_c0_g2_i2:235-729(-)